MKTGATYIRGYTQHNEISSLDVESMQIMLARLKDMKALARKHPNDGICRILELGGEPTWFAYYFRQWVMLQWPKFSGDSLHPVPHPRRRPDTAFVKAHMAGNMFSTRSQYGKNRWELVAYLIEQTELALKEMEQH